MRVMAVRLCLRVFADVGAVQRESPGDAAGGSLAIRACSADSACMISP